MLLINITYITLILNIMNNSQLGHRCQFFNIFFVHFVEDSQAFDYSKDHLKFI